MSSRTLSLFSLTGLVVCLVWLILNAPPAPGPAPAPVQPAPLPLIQPQPSPSPCPGPGPCPRKPRMIDQGPLLHKAFLTAQSVQAEHVGDGRIQLGGPVGPDGTEVAVDFPSSQDMRNIGSHRDGAGMCVMSSIEMAARWQGLEQMRGLRDWCAREPGGAYPRKVDDQLKRFCQAKGIECPPYIQYEGDDPTILDLAARTGRAVCVTYSGQDGVRYRGPIAHMVFQAGISSGWGTVYDNNGKPGELIWLPRSEYLRRWAPGGSGWAFVWLASPPPPVPRNLGSSPRQPQTPHTWYASTDADMVEPITGQDYTWHRSGADWILRRGNKQQGAWLAKDDTYYPLLANGGWGVPCSPPVPVPVGRASIECGKAGDYGVCWDKITRKQSTYTLSGRPADRGLAVQEMVRAAAGTVGAPGLTDDSQLPRLTLIGEGAPQRLPGLLSSPALSGLRPNLVWNAYPARHWALDAGFLQPADGTATVYLQKASGEVLVRRDGWNGTAEEVAEVLEAGGLRRPDGGYRPDRDPDGRSGGWSLFKVILQVNIAWALVAILVGLVVGMLLPRKEK